MGKKHKEEGLKGERRCKRDRVWVDSVGKKHTEGWWVVGLCVFIYTLLISGLKH